MTFVLKDCWERVTLTVIQKFLFEKPLSKNLSVEDKVLLSVLVMVTKNAKQTYVNVSNLNSYAIVDATVASIVQISSLNK